MFIFFEQNTEIIVSCFTCRRLKKCRSGPLEEWVNKCKQYRIEDGKPVARILRLYIPKEVMASA